METLQSHPVAIWWNNFISQDIWLDLGKSIPIFIMIAIGVLIFTKVVKTILKIILIVIMLIALIILIGIFNPFGIVDMINSIN